MFRRRTARFVILAAILTSVPVSGSDFRSILVDSWYWGSGYAIVSPSATQDTVNRIASWNANVILMEVRKRCDAYYTSTIEPRGTDPSADPGYDSLADMVTKAHAAGLEVHTWVVPYRVWTYATPPPHSTPEHIYYLHPEWFSQYQNGDTLWDGRYTSLDPGIPAVEDYLLNVFMDIVQRYAIDGFMFDYIRYYGIDWGYNPTAVARFNTEYGRTGIPSSTDPLWQQWRRDQVSNLVKRTYLEIKAVKPQLKVGALVWRTAASGRSDVLQDWDRWMTNHWMDYASPMNYTSDNPAFHANSLDSLGRGYGHHVYMGVDGADNTIENNIWQIQDARDAGFPGMHLYSYARCNVGTPDQEAFKNALLAGPFASPASAPDMPWLTSPTKGYLKGFIRDGSGTAVYPATATILGLGLSDKNSGTGSYGFSEIAPGSYTVRAESPLCVPSEKQVTITAGQVSVLDFTLQRETVPPVISNVRAESIQGTHAQIKWDTDEASTSQTNYGLTGGYGSTSGEDMARVTSHTVQLVGLRPFTTYHYRVRSYDAARNVVESSDYTFTTVTHDTPADIVIDNLDAGCSTYGTWWTGTISGKYGTNYYYTTTANPGRYAIFRPDILTPGPYDVYIWYTQGSNRSTQAKWRVYYDGGMQESRVNEQINGGKWNLLASGKQLACGNSGYVATYSNTGDTSSMAIIADAVKLVYKGSTQPPIAATIAEAKHLPDDTVVILLDKVVSAGFGDHFYICETKENQISGIRVNGHAPAEGSSVDLSAVLDTSNGERVLILPSVQPEAGPGVPRPIFMSNKWVGGAEFNPHTGGVTGGVGVNNLGLLIVLCGKVTQIGDGYLYVDDGSHLRDGTLTGEEENVGIRVNCDPSGHQSGDVLAVTGTSSCFEPSPGHIARRILARSPADLRLVYRQPAP